MVCLTNCPALLGVQSELTPGTRYLAGYVYWYPFKAQATSVVDYMDIVLSGSSTGVSFALALYADNGTNGEPGSLLGQTGTIVDDGAGCAGGPFVAPTALSVPVTAEQFYWVALLVYGPKWLDSDISESSLGRPTFYEEVSSFPAVAGTVQAAEGGGGSSIEALDCPADEPSLNLRPAVVSPQPKATTLVGGSIANSVISGPNPGSGRIYASYSVSQAGDVLLRLYGLDGGVAGRWSQGFEGAGTHGAWLDVPFLAPGIYFLDLSEDVGQGYRSKAMFKVALIR